MTNTSKQKQNNTPERGAIVIEATLSLSFFIFVMFTMLSFINIAYAQARIAVAVNAAAKEMSQYAQIYYATGMNEVLTGDGGIGSEITGEVAGAASTVSENIDLATPVFEMLDMLSGSDTSSTISSFSSEVSAAGDAIEGDNLGDYIKNASGEVLGKYFMQKNLSNYEGQTADDFLSSLRVVDGLDGIDFAGTSFLESTSGNVNLIVSYKIRVIELLGFEYDFCFSHYAYTKAWGSG